MISPEEAKQRQKEANKPTEEELRTIEEKDEEITGELGKGKRTFDFPASVMTPKVSQEIMNRAGKLGWIVQEHRERRINGKVVLDFQERPPSPTGICRGKPEL